MDPRYRYSVLYSDMTLIILIIQTFNKISASFTDNSDINDGWMLGSNAERLFWVPPTLRAGLLRPSNTLLIGEVITTKLDLTSFVHGESWSLCRESESLSILGT
jgi:hypothetical protein